MAPNIPGIVHRVVYEEPEPLSRFVPELPLDVERVMARAMAKDPAARYPTAEAFAEDAEDVVAGQPPRHAGGDDLVVVEESGTIRFRAGAAPAPPALSLPALPAAADANDTRTSLPPPRRVPHGDPSLTLARLLGAAVIVVVLVAIFVWIPKTKPRPEPAAAASAQPVPGTQAPAPAAPSAAGATAAARVEPGKLGIDFEHPLRRGRLKVFVDDELILDQRLNGQETKKAVVFTMHEGTFRDELDVAPGLHEVRIEVAWDGGTRVERIVGNFRPGVARKLEASLGRYRRDLRLAWK